MAADTKQPTLPEAVVIWTNDLLWSWINTKLALKEAKRSGKDTIHYACTVVPIPLGDPRRNLPPEDVLHRLGHDDIIARLKVVWGVPAPACRVPRPASVKCTVHRGGTDDDDNLQTLCNRCNAGKAP